MKLPALFSLLPLSVFAHSGHPGVVEHGNLTHLLLGLAVALPAALILRSLWLRKAEKAAAKARKQD